VEAPACTTPEDCDDEDLCTTDDCVDGVCVFTPIDCDDGEFCNGVETCDPATGDCVSPGNPCGEGEICDEATDSCVPVGEFVLTEDIDILIGTANPDTFRGSDDTYNTGDFLDGRGNTDRLDLTTVDDENDIVEVLDIELIFFKNTFNGQEIDLSEYSGQEQLWYNNGNEDLRLEFVDELAAVGFVGGRGGASDFYVEFGNVLVDGTETLSIFLDGADGGDLEAGNAAWSEGFETIEVNCTGNSVLEFIGSPDLQTALFSGEGSLELEDALPGVDTIDATGLLGDLDILSDDEDMTITGGDGNDTFRFGEGQFDEDDTVDCGAGDEDVLAIRLDDSLNQDLSILACEILSVQGDDDGTPEPFSVELDGIDDIQIVRVESHDTADPDTLSLDNFILNTVVMFRGDGDEDDQEFDSIVVDVDNAVTSLDIEFNNRGEDLDSDFYMWVDTIDIPDIETVTITNNDGGDTTIDNLDGVDITDLTVVSETDFIITNALESDQVDDVDGSGVEGLFEVSIANNAGDEHATMTGGSGENVLTGGDGDDDIFGGDDEDDLAGGPGDDTIEGRGAKDDLFGGDGDDTIFGGVEDDIITGGAGQDDLDGGDDDDEFRYNDQNDGAGIAVAGTFTGADADAIEDFEPDDDVLSFANAFLDNDVANSVGQNGTDLNTHGFIFINNAAAVSLTSEANVADAIGALANEAVGDQAAFVINNTAGNAAGVYAFISAAADNDVGVGELYLLAITDEAATFANLTTH
jgi:Ca2+-binding RTX toxin-like protein